MRRLPLVTVRFVVELLSIFLVSTMSLIIKTRDNHEVKRLTYD